MLEIRGLHTAYGHVPMLRDVDLDVAAGELVCILGPNGAGKTTTFRAAVGLVKPTSGNVIIRGMNTRRFDTHRIVANGIGLVPEGRRLFPGMSVRENLWVAYLHRGSDRPFEDELDEIAATFPRIKERLDQPAGTLSGGEQAMVALGRALIGKPAFLIMDEPSLGLSPVLIEEYFDLVRRIDASGKTILLIEQKAHMALSIADRGYILNKGRIVATGPARRLAEEGAAERSYIAGT